MPNVERKHEQPLLFEQFDNWRATEFKDHRDSDDAQVERVQSIERAIASFQGWIKAATLLGGMALSIFIWIMLEKNTTLQKQQDTMQHFTEQQQVVLTTLSRFADELKAIREDNKVRDDRMLQLFRGPSYGPAAPPSQDEEQQNLGDTRRWFGGARRFDK